MQKQSTATLIIVLAILILSGVIFLFIRNSGNVQDIPPGTGQVSFTQDYIERYQGEVTYEVPEVYELANIAIAISKYGQESPYRVYKHGDYYQRVLYHFLPFEDHPLFEQIEYSDATLMDYYSFRENSLAYTFEEDSLVPGGIFPPGSIWGRRDEKDEFSRNLTLLEDFAQTSDFRAFYADNTAYYRSQSDAYREAAQISDMWQWLENRFESRFDSYRVVFSPLIYASHSTQQFHDSGMSQTIMFMCGPDIYEDAGFSPAVQEGLIAKLLFTEIDHNYVGAVTREFREQIEDAFTPVSDWNSQDNSQLYTSATGTFDEYMTWGVFLLYARDTYPDAVYQAVADYTVNSMIQNRGFIRFDDFSEELLRLYSNTGIQMIAEFYPGVIGWAEAQ